MPTYATDQIAHSFSTGTFDTATDDAIKSKLQFVSLVLPSALRGYVATLTNVARFAAQAVTQHTSAYAPLLSITVFVTEFQAIVAANKPTAAASADPIALAVKRTIGLDVDRAAAAGERAARAAEQSAT